MKDLSSFKQVDERILKRNTLCSLDWTLKKTTHIVIVVKIILLVENEEGGTSICQCMLNVFDG